MRSVRKALEAAQAQIMAQHKQIAALQVRVQAVDALQARIDALELRGSDAPTTTTATSPFASRTMRSALLVLLTLLPLASCGSVYGHGYITNTNEATTDVSISLTGIASQTGNFLTIEDDGSNALASIDKDGMATFTGITDNAAVAFMAAKTAAQTDAAAEDVITFDEVITNVGSAYDSTTSTFTAPYDGVYRFSAVVTSDNGSTTGVIPKIYKNGADTQIGGFSDGEVAEAAPISAVLSLTQGDEITIVNYSADDDIYGSATLYATHFEGSLLTRT